MLTSTSTVYDECNNNLCTTATTTSIVYLQEIKQYIGGGKKEESEGEGYIIYTCRERKREEGGRKGGRGRGVR